LPRLLICHNPVKPAGLEVSSTIRSTSTHFGFRKSGKGRLPTNDISPIKGNIEEAAVIPESRLLPLKVARIRVMPRVVLYFDKNGFTLPCSSASVLVKA